MLGRWLNRFFGTTQNISSPKKLHLLSCQIHGSHYYQCLTLIEDGSIHQGDLLTLVREPENEYDEYAIEIRTGNNTKLGYVPKNHNRVIAELIDQGCTIDAVVEYVEPEQWEPVAIHIEWSL